MTQNNQSTQNTEKGTRRLANGRKEVNPDQIIRFDGNKVFVEIMKSAFPIKKVMMNFCQYEAGKGISHKETIYIDIPVALVLCQDILSGKIAKRGQEEKEKQKAGGYKYCNNVFMDQGGVSPENLAKQNKSRSDGKALSRVVKLSPGDKMAWIFQTESGPGEVMEKGLIKQIPSKIEKRVNVPLTDDNLKQFALILMKQIEAFYVLQSTQQYELAIAQTQLEVKEAFYKHVEKSDPQLALLCRKEIGELKAKMTYIRKQLGME